MFCEAVSLEGAKSVQVVGPRGYTGEAQVGGERVCRRLTKSSPFWSPASPPPSNMSRNNFRNVSEWGSFLDSLCVGDTGGTKTSWCEGSIFSLLYKGAGGVSRNRVPSLPHLQMRQQKRSVPRTHLCVGPTERKSDLLNCD